MLSAYIILLYYIIFLA